MDVHRRLSHRRPDRELHRTALEVYGGLDGVRSEQRLLSAVVQPEQTVFGQDAYETVADKAAAYGFFIAENQPFIDGNKRTGPRLSSRSST